MAMGGRHPKVKYPSNYLDQYLNKYVKKIEIPMLISGPVQNDYIYIYR